MPAMAFLDGCQELGQDGCFVEIKNTFLHVGDGDTTCVRRCRSVPLDFGWGTEPRQAANARPAARSATASGSSASWAEPGPARDVPGTPRGAASDEVAQAPAIILTEASMRDSSKAPASPRSGGSLAPSDMSTCAASLANWGARHRWSSDEEDDDGGDVAFGRSTLMLRNLPAGYSRLQLEKLFDAEGFAGLYDFVYLPSDIGTGTAFEYCFVNLVHEMAASRFFRRFRNFSAWPAGCEKLAGVHWSEALQGLDQLIERYRNSPLMHESVPDELKPAIYARGARVAFPPPTQHIRPPRVRRSAAKQRKRSDVATPHTAAAA